MIGNIHNFITVNLNTICQQAQEYQTHHQATEITGSRPGWVLCVEGRAVMCGLEAEEEEGGGTSTKTTSSPPAFSCLLFLKTKCRHATATSSGPVRGKDWVQSLPVKGCTLVSVISINPYFPQKPRDFGCQENLESFIEKEKDQALTKINTDLKAAGAFTFQGTFPSVIL